MRLFWKLFCSMVMITTLACAVGGYVLIDSQFRASLDREVAAVYEENDLLRYTLGRELDDSIIADLRDMKSVIEDINITTGRGNVPFRITDRNGNYIAGNGTLSVRVTALTGSIPDGQRGWEIVQLKGDRKFIHAASPLAFEGETLYLENCREITGIFTSRRELYRSFLYLMLVLIAVVGAASFGVASLMLRPLARLSAATKRMAEGELKHRVRVESDDELGQLSSDFNIMAARLEEQVQQLKDAAQRQEDFIGSFAHEIKTPLTSIIGYADLLRSRTASSERVRESAEYIFDEGRRLELLSHKLMELIVLEKESFSMRCVLMDAYLRRIGQTLQPVFEREGGRLRVRAEKAQIFIEPDLIESVCLNLLDNARKAIDGDGVVVLEGLVQETGYCIRVTDNGKGIPQQEISRITDAFYMVDKSRARAQGGAGLGLSICQKIVALHKGSMEFQSTVGAGTQVSVYLKGGENV